MDTTIETLQNATVSPRFVEAIPIRFARRFGLIGLDETDDSLTVAMASMERRAVARNVGVRLGLAVVPIIADESTIQRLINTAYSDAATGMDSVVEELVTDSADQIIEELTHRGDLLDNATHAPVVKLVNVVLFEAVKRRASDVHIQPYPDRVQVRYRIDGVLYDYVQVPVHLCDEIISRIKVIAQLNIAEKRLPQDGRTTVSIGERQIDLRISTLPTSHGERVVLRLLDKSARLYTLEELGMTERDLRVFRRLIRQTHGILLVTGPTGSGKSTTLYAALQELNSKELNILTIEDPIEYQLEGISQTQVSEIKGMTFATGLRTVLRQDPDVIMVGEIRDEATARMAVQSALTGHLVFSTLHTNDAVGAVARLLDLGIEPYLVAGSVIGVMAQRLVRLNCPDCARARALTDDECVWLGLDDTTTITEGAGCSTCLDTGFCDRGGVYELFEVDEEIRELIVGRSTHRDLKEVAHAQGMRTLREDAIRRMQAGQTTPEEVARVTRSDGPVTNGSTEETA